MGVHIRRLLGLLVVGWLLCGAAPAQAQAPSCSFAFSALSFGSLTLSAQSEDTTATFTANCTGAAGSTIRVCPNLNVGSGGGGPGTVPRYMLNGASGLLFNVFQDAARTVGWGNSLGGTGAFTAPAVDLTLNGNGQGSATRTVYGRVFGGQSVPAGPYASLLDGSVRYASGTLLGCAAIATNPAPTVLVASADYLPTCQVGSASLDFGPITSLTSPVTGSTSLSVTCNSGTAYQVGLGGGLSGASDPTQRKMTKGSDELVYGLYRDAGLTLAWGSTLDTNTVAGSGSGSSQSLTVYGRIPAQSVPPVGTYRDTVIVTLTY